MPPATIASASRAQRSALTRLLVGATAAAGRDDLDIDLAALVRAAPVELLPAAAGLHRVSGCVHAALVAVPEVPADVLLTLAGLRRDAITRHLRHRRALGRVAAAWDGAGLDWAVIKGPVLASVVYGDAGLRTYNDLDLLVAPQQLPEAVDVLEALGYEHKIRDWQLAAWFMASEFVMFDTDVELDVHWDLVYAHYQRRAFAIDPAAMLARARRVEVAGLAVPTFDAEDTLLHLCLHAARDGAHRLLWLKDVERALSVERADLDEVVRRAIQFRCAPSVGLTLDRARRALAAPVPAKVVADLLGRPLHTVERIVGRVSPSIRVDDRDTLSRFVARSLRADAAGSLSDLGRRTASMFRRLLPRRPNDTADPGERREYLEAVVRSGARR